jgi:hypothetical protein
MQDAAGISAGHESMAVLTHRRGFAPSGRPRGSALRFTPSKPA